MTSKFDAFLLRKHFCLPWTLQKNTGSQSTSLKVNRLPFTGMKRFLSADAERSVGGPCEVWRLTGRAVFLERCQPPEFAKSSLFNQKGWFTHSEPGWMATPTSIPWVKNQSTLLVACGSSSKLAQQKPDVPSKSSYLPGKFWKRWVGWRNLNTPNKQTTWNLKAQKIDLLGMRQVCFYWTETSNFQDFKVSGFSDVYDFIPFSLVETNILANPFQSRR